MQKLRFVPLAILSLSVGLMTACDSTSSNTVPTIDRVGLDDIPSTGLVAGQGSTKIHSTVTSEATGFTITFTVTNAAGTDKSSDFTINFTNPSSSDTKWVAVDQNATLAAKSGIANGNYTLKMTVSSSSGSNSASTTFTVVGGTDNPNPGGGTKLNDANAVDLGAQAVNGVGSFLSIEGAWSITSGEKKAADEDSVDVVFFASPSTSSGTPTFFSPAAAYAASLGKLDGWSVRHNTIIVSSPNALSTVEQVKALTDASSSHSATVSNGGWYAVKLDSGKYGLIHVTAFAGAGNAATATVEVFN